MKRINVLGVGISAITPDRALQSIADWVESGERHYVCVCAVHTVMECQRDPELRGMVNRASLAVPDGMPLVWISHLKGQPHVRRVYGPDLMLSFCELAARRGYTNYLLGGTVGQPELLSRRLVERFPSLLIVGGTATPARPISRVENEQIIAAINDAGPDVVWVGMGTGYQERWIAENRHRLGVPVLIGVGAAFDMHSRKVHQAPAWMQRSGLEWFFRLLQEPLRLWRRYLLGNPSFVYRLVMQQMGFHDYPEPEEPEVALPDLPLRRPIPTLAELSRSDEVPEPVLPRTESLRG
jgi:N-acetylglucosaminyldiphosphoundecaprenol N-acetyl-beta-D-mannosaminyltransferase